MTRAAIDGYQGVLAFIGLTLGGFPLVSLAIGGGGGLWGAVLPDDAGSLSWVLPVLVIGVVVVAIGLLERRKKRAG